MQVKVDKKSETFVVLTIEVDAATLKMAKEHSLQKLGRDVKVAGFRAGNAPSNLIEKAIDPSVLQAEFLDDAVNHSFQKVLAEHNIRPVSQPKVEVTKFVPYTTVEFTAEITTLGKVTLPDYKRVKKLKTKAEITKEEIDQVISNMQKQLAEKNDVTRAAAIGDQVWIDFDGKDDKDQPVQGASGKDYPLSLGSKTFIPGFEEELVGTKAGDEKTFTLTFPKDYGVKAMQGRKVTFTCKVTKVQEVIEPKVDNNFVKKVNPSLSSLKELRDDIKKQLLVEKQRQSDTDFEAEVINEITDKSKVELPDSLVAEQAEAVMRELRQNLTYRGLTYEEYLENYGTTEAEQREKEILPEAKRRLKAGLVLSEIADQEKITVTPEELEIRLQVLKNQYVSDPKMVAELENPENRRDVAGRLLTEKTIAKLVGYVTK